MLSPTLHKVKRPLKGYQGYTTEESIDRTPTLFVKLMYLTNCVHFMNSNCIMWYTNL